jgi:hypothetical protein
MPNVYCVSSEKRVCQPCDRLNIVYIGGYAVEKLPGYFFTFMNQRSIPSCRHIERKVPPNLTWAPSPTVQLVASTVSIYCQYLHRSIYKRNDPLTLKIMAPYFSRMPYFPCAAYSDNSRMISRSPFRDAN